MRIGGLAQLGEHLLCKQGVVGSIPSSSTNKPAGKRKTRRQEDKKIKPTPKRLCKRLLCCWSGIDRINRLFFKNS